MIKLVDILKEIEEKEGPIDLSDLRDLPDLIGAELEKAAEQQNEGILTAAVLAAAAPGIINSIMKVVKVIAKKAGIDLRKSPRWYEVIDNITEKIDNYLDTPFKVMLRPLIKDDTKRTKTAKFLKAVTLSAIVIATAIDITKVSNVAAAIKELAGESASELLQAISQYSLPKLADVVKNFLLALK